MRREAIPPPKRSKKMQIYCRKYKHNVETEAECMCITCIFWRLDIDSRNRSCEYELWHPGLKKGKDESK
jgi:hypothetical protein